VTTPSDDTQPSHERIGPAIGERFPDVVLPDQYGAQIDVHAARGQRPALIIFYRSARW